MKRTCLLLLCMALLCCHATHATTLKPGFDREEYLELLKICARHGDSAYVKNIPEPQHSTFLYRSPVIGIDNCWDLWMRDDKVAVLSIRGTTANQISWIANFYAAMVAAAGEIRISDSETFKYHLADNPSSGACRLVVVHCLPFRRYAAEDRLLLPCRRERSDHYGA